nr:hypothetical protein [uncultured Flavobacterium sp.]
MKKIFFIAALLSAMGMQAQLTPTGTAYYPTNTYTSGGAGTGGYYNTNVGYKAGNDVHFTSSYSNTFVGYGAGSATEGGENTGIGQNALKSNTTGMFNVAVGTGSMLSNTTGYFNIALGRNALSANTIGYNNISIGQGALRINDTGDRNIAIGGSSLWFNTSGKRNIAIGLSSGYSNQTGEANIFLGEVAGGALTSGNWNSFFGPYAGSSLTSGQYNLFVGASAGKNLTVGNYNAFFGNVQLSATPSTATQAGNDTSSTIIFADGNANQRLFIHSNGNTGIGLGNNVIPQNKLEIKGAYNSSGLRFTSLTNAATASASTSGKVLSVNATGDVILVNDLQGVGGNVTNVLDSSVNTMTSTVNGVAANAPIVNSVVNSINHGSLITTVNGVPSNNLQLPTFDGSETVIQAGTNVAVTGTGTALNPYIISSTATGGDCSIYNCNGTIDTSNDVVQGVRVVTMGQNNLFFNTAGSNFADGTTGSGRVYIGNTMNFPLLSTTPESKYRLLVEGGILTEKIKVALRSSVNWADYVFANDYKLMPLDEVETFVKENKHLPGVPSADNLVKEGLDLGEMQAKQMEKIEELTLYVIEQNKQIEKQGKEIEELKAQMKSLLNKNN